MKVGKLVKDELDLFPLTEEYWTDSQIVLGYIKNETARYKVFVANKVQVIRDYTDPKSWLYVKSKYNPADHASRGIHPGSKEKVGGWLQGPYYLWERRESWQVFEGAPETIADDPEVIEEVAVRAMKIEENVLLNAAEKVSSWVRYKRVVAWASRFVENCKVSKNLSLKEKKIQNKNVDMPELIESLDLSSREVKRAEESIVRMLQKEEFSKELTVLRSSRSSIAGKRETKKQLKKGSPLLGLDPFVDEEGLIRVGGRLQNSLLPYDIKHPIVMPKGYIATLYIKWCHLVVAHSGREGTLNEARRSGYWIITANSIVRRLIFKCVSCRKLRGLVMEQKMANLPAERVIEAPPFTHVGMDMYGHFTIKLGRKEVKRYGCIFTCLASRAVHLEVTTTMNTDS